MTRSTFAPLDLEGIDEGLFLKQADAALRDLQADLIGYAEQWKERAKGAKAALTLTVTLGVGESIYSITAAMTTKRPGPPPSITAAMNSEDQVDGRPALFVRRSGSTQTPPQQGRLATQDGRTVDIETGDPAPPRP